VYLFKSISRTGLQKLHQQSPIKLSKQPHRQICELVDQTFRIRHQPIPPLAMVLLDPLAFPQSTEIIEGIRIQRLLLELVDHHARLDQPMLRLVNKQRDGLLGGPFQIGQIHAIHIRDTQSNEGGYIIRHGLGKVSLLDQPHGVIRVLEFDEALQRLPIPPIGFVELGQTLHDQSPIPPHLTILHAILSYLAILQLILERRSDSIEIEQLSRPAVHQLPEPRLVRLDVMP
jgi:hypothetical protein